MELNILKPRMIPTNPQKLNVSRTITISLGFFTILLAFTYFNFQVPLILNTIFEPFAYRDTIKGIILALDNILAIFLQPIFGKLSDRTRSRLGRRIPFIIVGICGSALFLSMMPWVKLVAALIGIIFFFDLFMTLYRSPVLALLADYTPEKQRSQGSALLQFISNLSAVVAFLIPPIAIAMGFTATSARSYGFVINAILMVVLLVIILLTVRETPSGHKLFQIGFDELALDPISYEFHQISVPTNDKSQNSIKVWSEIGQLFRKSDKRMLFLLIAVFFWFLGFASVESYFSSFLEEYLEVSPGVSELVALVYPGSMIIAAPFCGLVGKAWGYKKSIIIGLIGMLITAFLLTTIAIPLKSVLLTAIGIALIGPFWMDVIVNSIPFVWHLAPEGKVGTYTGIYYTFNQLGAIISPPLLGLILDLAEPTMGMQKYTIMFPYIIICILLAFIAILFIRKKNDK
jgi:maltose/moltooligosaccharide transporter